MKLSGVLQSIFFSISILTTTLFASGGSSDVGGGGDTYAIEFVRTARDLVSDLNEDYPDPLLKIDLQHFKLLLDTSTVESTDKRLFLNRVEKDAINYPAQKKIIFTRKNWNFNQALTTRRKFVFHEYLGLMGLDDSSYQISSILLQDDCKRLDLFRLIEGNDVYCVEQKLDSYPSYIVEKREIIVDASKDWKAEMTPLMYAAFLGHTDIAEKILEKGAVIDSEPYSNALYWAVMKNQIETMALLIQKGANVNGSVGFALPKGQSVLHIAASNQSLKAVQLLVKGGADVNIQDGFERTPIYDAVRMQNFKVTQYLLKNGAQTRGGLDAILYNPARYGNVRLGALLIRYGARTEGFLNLAAENGRLNFVKFLLKKNVDVNFKYKDGENLGFKADGTTALHKAAEKGFTAIVKVLLKNGATLNNLTNQCKTPLDLAIEKQNPATVQFLRSKGALQGSQLECKPS